MNRATLLLLVSTLYLVSAADWAAVFLNQPDQQALCNQFYRANQSSSAQPVCEHMTLQYGGDLTPWIRRLGTPVKLRVIAFGEDEHAQAVMVDVLDDAVSSAFNFTHITVSTQNVKPYTPVYSNVLWQRIADTIPLNLTRDATGQIKSVATPDGSQYWGGEIPAMGSYPMSEAAFAIVSPSVFYTGVVCLFSHWSTTNYACN
eukprot:TRINITY_DN942_c0_g2_i1.p1 TRINITY_DN942_c0_g2~~TRINITY_DN942_c0_g2_i1.p1  ORF type:complete len:202 (+),score=56.68 TRINITY_DN942_c0_g2_i1:68-673(+)